jgi:hypothetical protein
MIHVYLLGIMANNKFPWGFCKIEVKCGERALQCEGRCTQWFHCRCVFGFEIRFLCQKRNGTVLVALVIYIYLSTGSMLLMFFTLTSRRIFQLQNLQLESSSIYDCCGHVPFAGLMSDKAASDILKDNQLSQYNTS